MNSFDVWIIQGLTVVQRQNTEILRFQRKLWVNVRAQAVACVFYYSRIKRHQHVFPNIWAPPSLGTTISMHLLPKL